MKKHKLVIKYVGFRKDCWAYNIYAEANGRFIGLSRTYRRERNLLDAVKKYYPRVRLVKLTKEEWARE